VTSASDWAPEEDESGAASIVRRAPYADNPFVGARGQQARQRIIDAALKVFGEVGYHECGVKRITELSGCSRAAFYQYFSSKEDLFRKLAGDVARLLAATIDRLEQITPGPNGHAALSGWFDDYAELYDTYAPVFVTFQTALTSDEAVATGAARVSVRTFTGLRSRVDGSTLSGRQLDNVIRAVPGTVARASAATALLRSTGDHRALAGDGRIQQAMADVFHRVLFGPDPDVNVHDPPSPDRAATGQPDSVPVDLDRELAGDPALSAPARQSRSRLLEAGHRVFATRGYYATNVADVVKAAGLSHGSFYRYFDNKTHLFRLLAERASQRLSAALAEVPPLTSAAVGDDSGAELRDWLRRYAETTADESLIIAMWSEAISRDPKLSAVSAAMTERFRATCAAALEPRGFGDVEAEALVMLVALDAMTTQRVTASRIETTAQIIERGLLTPPTR
jgi:AcrR family transcriptional regulator